MKHTIDYYNRLHEIEMLCGQRITEPEQREYQPFSLELMETILKKKWEAKIQ